jgi:quinol-cytochrome oxidoreductase complex cytochrome b subunit
VHDDASRPGWRNAVRVCLVLLGVALVILATTGVWLWFRYQPNAVTSWSGGGRRAGDTWIRALHRGSSSAAQLLALVSVVLLVGRRVRTGARGVVAGVGVLVTAVAAAVTGHLLPWDQLALWAVTVGTDLRGVQAIFDAQVKYVLVGSREISVGTYQFRAISHVVLAVLVAVAALLAWTRTRVDRAEALVEEPIAVDQ